MDESMQALAPTAEEYAAMVLAHKPRLDREPSLLEQLVTRGDPIRFVTVAEPIYIHYTEAVRLGLWKDRGPEWQAYVHELPQLLADGWEGRYVLVNAAGTVVRCETQLDGYLAQAEGQGLLFRVNAKHPLNRVAPLMRLCLDTNSTPTPTTD